MYTSRPTEGRGEDDLRTHDDSALIAHPGQACVPPLLVHVPGPVL